MTGPKFEIVGIGEILWDLLPAGKQLGGAPANFVCHAYALSASARLISRVGHDPAGQEIISRLAAFGLPTDTIGVDAQAPTGTVSVEVEADGQPRYVIHEGVAWDRVEASADMLAVVSQADAICFGTLAQRTTYARESIGALLQAARPDSWRILDINLRDPFIDRDVIDRSLTMANVLKLNEHELPILAGFFNVRGEVMPQIAALVERFSLRLVALTRGSHGSLLFTSNGFEDHPGMPSTVRDTVGAGDAFTAALTMGLLHGWPLAKISDHANAIAAFVCSQPGATPPLPEILREPFNNPR
ncbi:MAG TPA: carbohydrate kinase [Chthoniobacter sp.]|jgi:fructokinase